jgi:hypothetical protein
VPLVITVAAVLAVVLLAGLAVLQGALLAGAPLGHLAWGGRHRVLPRRLRIGSALSIALYAFFALTIWASATRLSVPGGATGPDAGIWLLTAYVGVGVALNAASRSRPERLVMTPVCLVLPPAAWRSPCGRERTTAQRASAWTDSSSRNSSMAMREAPTRPERSGASLTVISSARAASGIDRR